MTYIAPLPKKLVKNAKAKMMNNIKTPNAKTLLEFARVQITAESLFSSWEF